MPVGDGREARLDAPVLVAGDAEADLGALVGVLAPPGARGVLPSVAQGVPAACAALRLSEFAVVVADVSGADDALAILRAAGRGRPAARVLCLLPAGYHAPQGLREYLSRAAFAVRRHPVAAGDLADLVTEAAHDFLDERTAWSRIGADRGRWVEAERALTVALRRLVVATTGRPGTERTLAIIDEAVAAAVRAARTSDDGLHLLHAIAMAIAPAGRSREDAA